MGNGTDIKWVDSVLADLKPTTAATLGATVALAKGLGAATDGGGGVYQWFGTAATAEDGEHLVNRTGGGGRWERINGARTYFNVLDHGLVRTRLRTHASTISSTGTTVTTASGVADIIGASASITANGETRRVVTVVNPTTLTIDMAFTPDLPAGTKFSYMNRRGSGTLSISGTAVTGSGTSFASELLVGETIVAAGQAFVVASIASNTSLTITTSATVASTTFDHYFDNRSKLADLIEVVDKAGGGTIFFPAGTYVFAADGSNKVITVAGRTNLRFLGEGPASRLLWFGQFSGAGHFFDVTLGSRFITFEQLALLEGDGAKTDTSVQHHAIRINNEPVLGTDLINNIEHIAVLNCYFGAMPGDGVNCCGGTAQNACLADIPANVSPIGGTIKNPRNPQRVTVRYFKDWDGGDITIHGTIEPVRGRRVALAGHVVTLLAKQAKAFSVGMTVIASPNQSGASFRTGTTTVTAVHTADPGIPGDVDTITLANAAAISGFSDQDYLFELVSETVVAPVPVTAAFETRVTETEFRKIYGVTKSATGMLNPSPKASIGFAYLVRDVHVVGNTFNGFDYSGRTNGNDLNNSGFRCAVAAQRLSTDIFIQRNQMTGCGGQLIDFEPSGIGTTDHWVIEDNVIVNANPVGAALETAVTLFGVAHPYNRHNRRSRFCNNAVYGRILGGQMTGCDISDNVIVPIHGATMSAVSLTGRCDDVIVAGNQILPGPGVTATPISFTLDAGFSATGVTVRDNRIEWYGNTGMELDGVTSATVAGNHFAYRSTNVNTGKALRLDSPANRLVGRISIEGNIIEGDRGGGSLEHGISISHGPPLAFQAIGTAVAGTSAAPAWPTHVTDDIGLLFVESNNTVVATPTDWSVLVPPITDAGNNTRLQAFWRRADNSIQTAPTVTSGNHVYAVIMTLRGAVPSGEPQTGMVANGSNSTTAMAIPGIVTTSPHSLIALAMAWAIDNAGPLVPSFTNASLANLVERFDAGTTFGNGGGLFLATGDKPIVGTVDATTATLSSATEQARAVIEFKAPTRHGISLIGNRGTGIQTNGINVELLSTSPPVLIGNDFAGASHPLRLPAGQIVVISGNAGDVQGFRGTVANPNSVRSLDAAPLSSTYTGGDGAVWQKVTAGASGWYTVRDAFVDRPIVVSPVSGQCTGGAITWSGAVGVPYATAAGVLDTLVIPLPLKLGDRLKSIDFHHQRSSGTLTFTVYRVDMLTATQTQVGTATTVGSGTTYATTSSAAIDHVILAGHEYFIQWLAGAGGNRFYGATLIVDRP